MSALLSGVAAGYAIAIPVGAIAIYLIALGAHHGWRVAAGGAMGAASVDGLYAALAVTAGAALAPWIRVVEQPLRWLSVAALVALAALIMRPAFRGASSGRRDDTKLEQRGPVRGGAAAFTAVAGLTLINPVTLLYLMALAISLDLEQDAGPWQSAPFVVGALAASASRQLLLATAGSSVGRLLTGRRGEKATALVGGATILLLALQAGFAG